MRLEGAKTIRHDTQICTAGVVDFRGGQGRFYAFALMFAARGWQILANMSEIDRRADTPEVDWSELGVSELPTGTVTLLLADVEGSTRLWQTQPEEMTAAVARVNIKDVIGMDGR